MLDFKDITSLADEVGFTKVATRKITSLDLSIDLAKLSDWQISGFGAEMSYMNRPASLFSDLNNFLMGTKSIITFIYQYKINPSEKIIHKLGYGSIASYAWLKDYHLFLKKMMLSFIDKLKALSKTNFNSRVFTDAVPLLERAIATKSKLGGIGKNSMLISKGIGSFNFICEILLDVDVEEGDPDLSFKKICGSCTSCMSSCPTSAIVSERIVNANKCISYLTIEKKGCLTLAEGTMLGNWIFGCDICQEVCPYNSKSESFMRKRSAEELKEKPIQKQLEILELLKLDKLHFNLRFAGTAIMRAGYFSLLRNGIFVALNQKNRELKIAIEQHAFSSNLAVSEAASFYLDSYDLF